MQRVHRRLALCALLAGLAAPAAADDPAPRGGSVLDFSMKRLDGSTQDLADYKGKVVMVVNTASKCGFTPQYEGLETLYDTYKDRGFVVLGFPSNDFAGQEPGSDAQIAEFCRATYSIRFPMFSKISVKGDDQHPLYQRITALPKPIGGDVKWNFQKYLLDRNGQVVAKFPPKTKPEDPEIVAKIEELL
jgi:glutathione peroxidase